MSADWHHSWNEWQLSSHMIFSSCYLDAVIRNLTSPILHWSDIVFTAATWSMSTKNSFTNLQSNCARFKIYYYLYDWCFFWILNEVKKTFSEYVHPLNKRFPIFWMLLKVLLVCLSPLMIDILRCISYMHIHDEYMADWLL